MIEFKIHSLLYLESSDVNLSSITGFSWFWLCIKKVDIQYWTVRAQVQLWRKKSLFSKAPRALSIVIVESGTAIFQMISLDTLQHVVYVPTDIREFEIIRSKDFEIEQIFVTRFNPDGLPLPHRLF